jgi:hypothetical protein
MHFFEAQTILLCEDRELPKEDSQSSNKSLRIVFFLFPAANSPEKTRLYVWVQTVRRLYHATRTVRLHVVLPLVATIAIGDPEKEILEFPGIQKLDFFQRQQT